jgi:hypothetical protein
MKRDLQLIRKILLDIEEQAPKQLIFGFTYEGKTTEEIMAHVELLEEAGYIEAIIATDAQGFPDRCVVKRLTWNGHEFLSNAKNDTVWKKVLQQAEEKGMSTSMTVINGLLEAAAKKYMGLE